MKFTWLALGMVSVSLAACGGSTTTDLDSGAGDATTDAKSDGGGGGDSGVTDSGGGPCDGGACGFGLHCCNDTCVNENNDPQNCGGCGTKCSGSTAMCLGGSCTASTCQPACADGQTCCQIDGPGPSGPPKCVVGTTCPVGCPACN